MLPVSPKTYKIFDVALLGVNVVIAGVYFGVSYSLLAGAALLGTSIYTTTLSASHAVYFFTLYRYLRKKTVVSASLVGFVLFAINLALLLATSGGIASPYFGFWLIAILVSGIYRALVPLALVAVSTIYFIAQAALGTSIVDYISTNGISLVALYITGALGFWLWHSQHTKVNATSSISKLSEELTKSELRSEIVLRGIGDGVLLIDNKYRVQLMNKSAERLTGWSEAEAKGIDYHIVLPLADMQDTSLTADNDPFAQAVASKRSILREDVYLTPKSGKRMTLSIMFSAINTRSGFSGGIAIFRDISQLKAVERQRNEFISTASHEMRSPIAAIEGYIALALNPKISKIDDTSRSYLIKAKEATTHLGKLFQDLLAATKIEEGKLPNHPEPVQLDDLISKVLDEMRFKAAQKKIKLTFSGVKKQGVDKKLSPLYYALIDPNRVREVLVNLIDNGIKFTPKGEVTVSLTGDDKNITIGVTDQGIGIAPADQAHLFQKFYRVDNSQTRNIGGTGLGLYISRAIVELYGGRIWAESRPGQGSKFYFTLPRLTNEKAQSMLRNGIEPEKDSVNNSPKPPVASYATDKVE